ncbi:hypothetical protein PMAYCL1PPCAC_09146, partial [Pristionchus mayeri]
MKVYVDRAHHKAGLFQFWLDYDMSYRNLAKQTGANYYGVVCSAHATKVWCKKLGFTHAVSSADYVVN